MDLSPSLVQSIQEIASCYPEVKKVALFGSRARGDNQPNSDIDLAVWADTTFPKKSYFCSDIDDLNTLLKIDLVFIDNDIEPLFLENIQKEGVVLVDTVKTKAENLRSAVLRLQESIAEYQITHSTSVRDGAIQRFEFCCELAWKALKEYLIEEGFLAPNTPRAVLKESFAAGILDNEQGWLNLLNDRNITSHMYNEKKADDIYTSIVAVYYPLLRQLADKLNQ